MPEEEVTARNLGELVNRDLAGFRLMPVFWLERKHGLWGFFPAICTATEKAIIVTDKTALRVVWDHIPHRIAKIGCEIALVHQEQRLSFPFDGRTIVNDREPDRVFSREDLEALSREEGAIKWFPGVLQNVEEPIQDPDFEG